MIVGQAEILIVPDTAGFKAALKEESDASLGQFKQDAAAAGTDAGAALRTGVTDEAGKLENDLGDIGSAGGVRLRDGVKGGAAGLENDLASIGAASGVGLRDGVSTEASKLTDDLGSIGAIGGTNLREGVRDEAGKLESDLGAIGSAGGVSLREGVGSETGKLADDLAKDGEDAGEGLHRGLSGGLSKIAGLIGATGLPLEHLQSGFERAGEAAEDADHKSSGLMGTLEHVGGIAALGVGAAFAGMAAEGVHLAEGMQQADASIASATGTSVKAATQIGDAFEGTAFKSEFGAKALATAYASVAGQLKSTEGHALDANQALQVMSAADDLATAKQIDLGTATSTVAGVMQAFQLKAQDAAHVSDVLFQASSATGQGVDSLGSSLERIRSKLGDTGGSLGDLSALLVDMTDRGITGRASMSALNGAMSTLQKTAEGVQTATTAQKSAFDELNPQLQQLATQYVNGTLTSTEFSKATEGLPTQQAALVQQFVTANTALDTAQEKYKQLGVTVFDAQGKFVGMGSIIDQLHPKFADMTQQQQLAAASTLFGASAAKQMVEVIDAGPAAFDAASASVNKMGAAHDAASKQSQTLKVEEETLEAGLGDLATRIGQVLIPVITSMVGAFVTATAFVTTHKAALIALAAVITGTLGVAISVFAVNKMAQFAQSFSSASDHVKSFANDVQTAVGKVVGLFSQQSNAAEESAGKIEASSASAASAVQEQATKTGTATATMASDTTAATSTIETENTTAGASYEGVATKASAAAGTVGTETAAMASDTTAADSTIEGDNAAAGASYTEIGTEASAAAATVGTEVASMATETGAADTTIEADNAAAGASYTAEGGGAAAGAAEAGLMGTLEHVGGIAAAGAGIAGYSLARGLSAGDEPGGKPTKDQQQAGLPGTVEGPSAPTPTPSSLSANANPNVTRWAADAQRASALTGVPASLLLADINQESGGTPVHSTGSTPGVGNLTQFLPSTAKGYGVQFGTSAAAIQSQITGQAEYLKALGATTNPGLALAKYNAGPGNPAAGAGYARSVLSQQGDYAGYDLKEHSSFDRNAPGTATVGLPSPAGAERQASAAAERAVTAAAEAERTAAVKASAAQQTAAVQVSARGQSAAVQAAATTQATAMKTAAGEQGAEAKKQTSAVSAGSTQLNRMLTAIHSGSLSSLKTALSSAHTEAMRATEKDLDRDHSTALATLSKELVQVHQEAMDKLAKAEASAKATAAATKAADAATAAATAITDQTRVVADQAKAQSDSIADQSKVTLDQQAQAGLSGASLVAAQAQTSYDQVVQQQNQAVDAAQTTVDQAAGSSAVVQAQASLALAQAQATASVQEAQAQAALDQANAAASAAAAAATPTDTTPTDTSPTDTGTPAAAATSTATTTNQPTIILNINGSNVGPAALVSEIGFALKTGAMPVGVAGQ